MAKTYANPRNLITQPIYRHWKKKKEIKQFSARNLTILNNLKGNAHIENMSLKKGASRLY